MSAHDEGEGDDGGERGFDPAPWRDALCARFGLPEATLSALHLFRPNTKAIGVTSGDHEPPPRAMTLASGVLLVHARSAQPKLTTAAARALGHLATRHIVTLDAAQTDAYLRREALLPRADQLIGCETPGVVLVRHETITLGTGLLRLSLTGEPARLESYFPRAQARDGARSAFGEVGP